jgi:hypothetical protein
MKQRASNSAAASQPYPLGHITADEREIRGFPKFATQTSSTRHANKTNKEVILTTDKASSLKEEVWEHFKDSQYVFLGTAESDQKFKL